MDIAVAGGAIRAVKRRSSDQKVAGSSPAGCASLAKD